jgi:hypothetical protein
MITKEEAKYYNEQLHPAFAGYLYDGNITQKDALATIFNLLIRGCIDPVWKDNNILKGIIGARLMNRKPQFVFEQQILDLLFKEKQELSVKEIRRFIVNNDIQKIIKKNLNAVLAFPIINEELQFKLGFLGRLNIVINGNPINTVEKANSFRRIVNRIFPFALISISVLTMFGYLFALLMLKTEDILAGLSTKDVSLESNKTFREHPEILLKISIIWTVIVIIYYLIFTLSKKVVTYEFKNKIAPVAKEKYIELYEFLKKYPLEKHRFTNEFLAFSIAFGLDTSWNKDFELEEEIQVDQSPIVS